MKEGHKTEEQLISELTELRQKLAELDALETQHQQAEAALAHERDLLQALMDNSPDYVFFKDTESRFIRTNRAHAQWLGLDNPNQAIGKTDFDFFSEEYARQFYDEEQQIMVSGQPIVAREWKVPSDDGQMIWLSEHKIPLMDEKGEVIGLLGISRDITERMRAERALQESERRYRTLIENQGEGIGLVDEEERFAFANPAAHELFGLPPGELVGRNLSEFVDAETFDRIRSQTEARRSGERSVYELEINRPDGHKRHILVTATPRLDSHGGFTGSLGIFRDVTEQVRAQRALRQRTAQLEALREVGMEITAQLELDALLRSIVSRALELLGGISGGLYLYQPERDVLELSVFVGSGLPPVGDVIRRGEGIVGRVWETNEPLFVDDYRYWEGRLPTADEYSFTAVIGVPVYWGESSLGVLLVLAGPPQTFSPADAELMSLFATQAAIAINNARLFEQAREDAESRATLLREVNHRISNNLAAIIALLEIEQGRGGVDHEAAYRAIMDDLINRIHGLATVHRLLSASQWSPLLLSEIAEQVIASTLNALPREKFVSVEVSPTSVRVAAKQANNLALVFNELTTNSIKYAWPDRQAGQVMVRFDHQEGPDSTGTIVLEFRDDGVGFPDEMLRLEGHHMGWRLIQTIVGRGLGGELCLRNDGGAVTTIRFPEL